MPLYGATAGILAQQEANRQSLDAGLSAQQKMGDLAMLPAKFIKGVADARLSEAQATSAESEAQAAQTLQMTQMRYLETRREAAARKQLSDAAAASGKLATVADLPGSGSVTQASQAEDLEKFADFASDTLPPVALAKVRGEIATIRQREAAGAASNASAGLNNYKQEVARFETVGNLAGAAALSEANYHAMMMSPQRALLPKELTGNYRTDAPVLRMIEQASQDSIKRAKLNQDILNAESKRRLDQANQGRVAATIDNLKLRKTQLTQDISMATKSGGKYSPEAIELKKAQIANQKSLLEARNQKTAPPMPLDPALIEVGKTYTGAGGVKYDIVGLDAKGLPIGRLHVQGAFTEPAEATAPAAEATDYADVTEGESNGRYD